MFSVLPFANACSCHISWFDVYSRHIRVMFESNMDASIRNRTMHYFDVLSSCELETVARNLSSFPKAENWDQFLWEHRAGWLCNVQGELGVYLRSLFKELYEEYDGEQ